MQGDYDIHLKTLNLVGLRFPKKHSSLQLDEVTVFLHKIQDFQLTIQTVKRLLQMPKEMGLPQSNTLRTILDLMDRKLLP